MRDYLRVLGVSWEEAPRLVRGLDYYTRTAFEFSHELLGAQSGIGGGGRYDGLMADLGGAEVGGIGFGLGVDRTLLACAAEGIDPAPQPRCVVYGIALGAAAERVLVGLLGQLRGRGIATDMAFGGRGLRGAMKGADRSGARWALIIGERDLAAGRATLRDLGSGAQHEVALEGEVVGAIVEAREVPMAPQA